MTPLPKKRRSTMRQGRHRSIVWRLKLPNLIECPNCHQPTRPHRSCLHCGYYKGRKVN